MAKVLLEDWKEQYRDERIERMSRDEMSALQSERLVKQVKNVYEHVSFYKKKMDDLGVEPGDIKGIEDITKLPFTTKEDLRNNYPFGLLAVPKEKITRVQGTSGTTGKLTLASYTNKDVEVWGGMCGKRTYHGRTYSRRQIAYLLWVWTFYRRSRSGLWSTCSRSNGNSDVFR